ncbi:hypothetical protein ACFQ1E_11730 [Sphingomonas canadensis]|uniref:DUF883 family protein n=1 Tax=Sphingomonas canadensis TaxID=1219257 RepID=A0ABW3H6Z5_9SPHN|nr:hypothetical protein [Sphingomonas canadensis]MCW3836856.1 hypothetical protein [Sphingomonas canadensis]
MARRKSPETEGGAPVIDAPAEEAGTTGGAKRSAADTIRDEAGKLGSQAKEKARAYAEDGMGKASSALDEVAKLMKGAADDVDDRIGPEYGKYARSAAQGISGFADTLRGKPVEELIDDVSDFVKKSPVIAIGTAAAVGFVLARLIKSGIDAAADLGDPDEPANG